jgi:hypothetical protein
MFRFRARSRWQYAIIIAGTIGFYVLLGYAQNRRGVEVAGPAVAEKQPGAPVEPSFAAQLAAVQAGRSVEIRLLYAPVGDRQLEALAGLENLERLNLPRATFTDAGLAKMADLPNLTLLRFGSPNVTDAGMRSIAHLPKLRFLHLIEVPITDAGLAELHELKQLESFYIDGGRTTDAGLQALVQAVPDLHIHRDQLHLPGDKSGHSH